jgi:MFS family permease
MGFILACAMGVGIVIGLVVTGLLSGFVIIMMIRIAKNRIRPWRFFAWASAVFLVLLILAMQYYPYGVPKPGSDYNIGMKNFFIGAFGYSIIPGIALFLAMLAVLLFTEKNPTLANIL